MKVAPTPPRPLPVVRLTWEGTLVHDPGRGRVKCTLRREDGSRSDAWATKDDLPDYDTIVKKIKRKGEMAGRITAEKVPGGWFRITRIEPL
jgi:hypothetical protein